MVIVQKTTRINTLITKVPIDKIIEKTLGLKGSGRRYLRGIEHDSLVVDLEKNKFYWNSIGLSGNALTWLTQVQGLSYKDSLYQLQKYSGLPFTRVLDEIEKPVPIYPKLLNTFANLGRQDKYRAYWYNRGFNAQTLNHFKVGHTGKFHVIPVIVDGELVNFHCRLVNTDGSKRVWHWGKNRPPYPVHTECKHSQKYTVLAEGFPDLMMLYQLGYPTVSQDSGPQSWQKSWNRFLVTYNTIFILFDNDLAGINGARRTAKKMLGKARIALWPAGFPDKYDVNAALLYYGQEETKRLINNVLLPNSIYTSDFPNDLQKVMNLKEKVRKVAQRHGFETPRVF